MVAALEPGNLFPSVTLFDENGERADIPEPKGEALYGFFKTTCPTSELAWPYFERIRRLADGALPVVAVSQDGPVETAEFNRRLGVRVPTLFDPEPWNASEALGLDNVPTFFLVDEEGRIVDTVVGFQRRKLAELGARAAERAGREEDDAAVFRAGDHAPELKPG
jgi:peroxiredoxin